MLIKKLITRPVGLIDNADVIINWNPLKRCILMLVLCGGLNILWIIWKIYILLTPSVQAFVHLALLNTQLKINFVFLITFLLLIYPCLKLQHSRSAQQIMPYICVAIFALNLCLDGYLVGLLSPATAIVVVSVTAVGLLLFDRKVIYSILMPSLLILVYMMYKTIQGELPYAPLFNFTAMQNLAFTNSFWVGSMFLFMCIIALTCFILFDLMLKQWQAREHSFKILSQIDPLTETFNRRSINQHLLEIEQDIRQHHQQYGIILLDLDFFKHINDTYGHLKGDEVLIHVAETLKNNIRYCDIVGRYGGEEFIIIVENTNPTITYQIAERCRQALMNLSIASEEGHKIDITASFGVAFLNTQHSVQQALHLADVAMYEAKDTGRNTVIVTI